jgi:hypothetical protein
MQCERPFKLFPVWSLRMTTFKKLPIIAPNIKATESEKRETSPKGNTMSLVYVVTASFPYRPVNKSW